MPETWTADDLPATYWILGTLHGYRFILDPSEGDRVQGLLRNYETHQQPRPLFLRFVDYTGVPAFVQYDFIDALFCSTPSSRSFDDAMTTDRKKPGWGNRDDA